jgi:hypothetical protein
MTVEAVALEPVVSWPREAAPGGRYLVTVDLRSAGEAGWPYPDEEYPVGLMLSGDLGLTVETLGEASVVLHRFGGTYGAARFVVTVGSAVAEGAQRRLRLTLLSAGGVPFHTVALAVTVTRDAPVRPATTELPPPTPPSGPEDRPAREVTVGSDVCSIAVTTAGGGPLVALGADDGHLHLWRVGDPIPRKIRVGAGPVHVAASPTNGLLFVGSGEDLMVVDPATAAIRSSTRLSGDSISALCLVPGDDSTEVVVGTRDGMLVKAHLTSQGMRLLHFSYEPVTALCYAETLTGAYLVAGGQDGLLTPLTTDSLETLTSLAGHTGAVNRLTAVPSGQGHFASAGADGTVRLWNLRTMVEERRFEAGSPVTAITYVAGQPPRVVWGDESGAIWWLNGANQPALVDHHEAGPVTALAISASGAVPDLVVARRGGRVKLVGVAGPNDSDALLDQRFVVYVFASLLEPGQFAELTQMRAIWRRCHALLGLTEPINGIATVDAFPDDPASAPQGVMAGWRDSENSAQAILRREGDVLVLALLIEAPPAGDYGAGGPGWHTFTRYWQDIAADGTRALLGVSQVYLAISRVVDDSAVRSAFPEGGGEIGGWWTRQLEIALTPSWEVTAERAGSARRLAMVSTPGNAGRAHGLTWGDDEKPPVLARYLRCAAEMRRLSRARSRDKLEELRGQVRLWSNNASHRPELLPGGATALAEIDDHLRVEAEVLRRMRVDAERLRTGMVRTLGELLPSDRAMTDTFINALDADLRATEQLVPVVADLRTAAGTADSPSAYRTVFAVSVEGFGTRPAPGQAVTRQRLIQMTNRIMRTFGQWPDVMEAGDTVTALLPSGLDAATTLPRLLQSWQDSVAADNAQHPDDPLRVRLAVGAGLLDQAIDGFAGVPVMEANRLLDSGPLRRAAHDHPDTDLVAIVTDEVYPFVRDGFLGVNRGEFERLVVDLPTYQVTAWLWIGDSRPATARPVAASGRDVLLIHDGDADVRRAITELLRALDLRPVDWNEFVASSARTSLNLAEVMRSASGASQAILIVFSGAGEGAQRSNVYFEAGMALATSPDRTIVVEVGGAEHAVNLAGRNVIRLGSAPGVFVQKIAQRLRAAGCPVNTSGTDWLASERFASWTRPTGT